jgi:hypothetical protein
VRKGDHSYLYCSTNTLSNYSETAILKVYVILRTRRQAKYGKQLVGHSGGYPGFVGRTWLWIDDGITVSVLANAYDTAPGIVTNSILGIIDQFGELMKYEFDAKNKPSAMYRSGAKNYVSLDGDIKV